MTPAASPGLISLAMEPPAAETNCYAPLVMALGSLLQACEGAKVALESMENESHASIAKLETRLGVLEGLIQQKAATQEEELASLAEDATTTLQTALAAIAQRDAALAATRATAAARTQQVEELMHQLQEERARGAALAAERDHAIAGAYSLRSESGATAQYVQQLEAQMRALQTQARDGHQQADQLRREVEEAYAQARAAQGECAVLEEECRQLHDAAERRRQEAAASESRRAQADASYARRQLQYQPPDHHPPPNVHPPSAPASAPHSPAAPLRRPAPPPPPHFSPPGHLLPRGAAAGEHLRSSAVSFTSSMEPPTAHASPSKSARSSLAGSAPTTRDVTARSSVAMSEGGGGGAAGGATPGKEALLERLRLVQEERERLLHKAAARLARRKAEQDAASMQF